MKTICINLGSNTGRNKIYVEQTIILAKTLVFNDYHVVYGGADVGLMGVLANTVLEHRGRITGVIPEHIAAAVGHKSLTELIVVKDMHERKQRMFELSDAFIALPGGYGTLDEVFELLTWAQLGLHRKPLAFFTIDDYFRHLELFLDHAEREGFIRPEHRHMLVFEKDAVELLKKLSDIKVPVIKKWIV
jgi:uncharacterized protein (TIGR00730 family)